LIFVCNIKKNILAIAILAAVIANIILSAIILFSVVPAANNANKLVERICTVINLELENPDATSYAKVPIASRKPFVIGNGLTINLKRDEGESKSRYALLTWTLYLNSDADDFKEVTAVIEDHHAVLNEYMMNLIKQYTAKELSDHEAEIKGQMLSYCRTYFRTSDDMNGSDLVVDLTMNLTVQY
jgi:flagellar FliL protein